MDLGFMGHAANLGKKVKNFTFPEVSHRCNLLGFVKQATREKSTTHNLITKLKYRTDIIVV